MSVKGTGHPARAARAWRLGGLLGAIVFFAAPAARAHPVAPVPHQPDARFCMADYGFPPKLRAARDAAITESARADVIVYAGNIRKWWFPLAKRSDGKTVRDLHPGVKVLQYLSAGEFPAVATPNDAISAPTGQSAYLHTRTLTVGQYLRIARRVGAKVPEMREPRLYGFPGAILEFFGGPYTVRANPGGADFIAHAKRYARLLKKKGGDGVFLDNLTAGAWLLAGMTSAGGDPMRLPPWCFTLADGRTYWQHVREGRPVPALDSLKRGEQHAVSQIRDLSACRATGAPAEWKTVADARRAEWALVRALKAERSLTVMFNGLHVTQKGHALRVLEIADGGMMEGFVVGQRPRFVAANLELARRAAKLGKWVMLSETRRAPEEARYSYGAYLLVAAPNVCWTWGREALRVPEMDVLLGPARGSYRALPEGEGRPDQVIYHRAFARGDVYVNPQERAMPAPGGTLAPRSAIVRPRSFAHAD